MGLFSSLVIFILWRIVGGYVLEKLNYYLQRVIGKRVNRDIFSDKGDLLLPCFTIVTYDHIMTLEEYDVTLENDDVIAIGSYTKAEPYQHHEVIDETVKQVSKYFEEIGEKKKIPIVELRKDVIPMIHTLTDGTHLLDLFTALQAKDDYTYRHNIAVGALSNLLGRWLRLDHQELLQLTTAALLHDVGKMMIPETILNKPGKLTAEEYEVIKNHTVYGYNILKETNGINHRQALVALQHHERMDGSGYPFGVNKERIDVFSRIVAVADIFHAMTSNRVYRNPSPFYEVLLQMNKDTFGALDPVVTRVFIEKIMNCLIGHSVLLTNGSEGIIIMVPTYDPTRPLIQVGDRFIDLSKDLSVHIEQLLT
ncbi:HD-GYP domain-containing protein [bacterium LRH843]|nr:HD-GYP domain-containing protein [bacterium LRH843]